MDDSSDDEFQIKEDTANQILSIQISSYQHIQRSASLAINVTIGIASILIAGIGSGVLRITDFQAIGFDNLVGPLGVEGEIVTLTVLLSLLTLLPIGGIVLYSALFAYSGVVSLLLPRNVSPIYELEGVDISVGDDHNRSDLERALNKNREILKSMQEQKIGMYYSFILFTMIVLIVSICSISVIIGDVTLIVMAQMLVFYSTAGLFMKYLGVRALEILVYSAIVVIDSGGKSFVKLLFKGIKLGLKEFPRDVYNIYLNTHNWVGNLPIYSQLVWLSILLYVPIIIISSYISVRWSLIIVDSFNLF